MESTDLENLLPSKISQFTVLCSQHVSACACVKCMLWLCLAKFNVHRVSEKCNNNFDLKNNADYPRR